MSNLTKRIITAITLLTIASLSVYFGIQYFIYLVHLIVLLLQIELSKMFFKGEYKNIQIPFIAACFLSTIVYNYASFYFMPFLFLLVPSMLSLLMVSFSEKPNQEILRQAGLFALGFVYIGLLPSLTTKILLVPNGVYWMLTCLAVVFSGDIAAYFFGSRFGKKKVMPQISPNKTWEGSIAGLLCSIIFSVGIGSYFFPYLSPLTFILSGIFASILAQSGDFFESLIKRVAGQKDSGSFLPGHGGFLDRFDGLLFAIPVYYYLSLY